MDHTFQVHLSCWLCKPRSLLPLSQVIFINVTSAVTRDTKQDDIFLPGCEVGIGYRAYTTVFYLSKTTRIWYKITNWYWNQKHVMILVGRVPRLGGYRSSWGAQQLMQILSRAIVSKKFIHCSLVHFSLVMFLTCILLSLEWLLENYYWRDTICHWTVWTMI